MKYWSRSSLSIYKYLETMSETLDKIIMDTGKSSYSYELQKYQTTYYQTNKIIQLIERKRKMINLRIGVEKALNSISLNSRKLLTLSYIDGVKSDAVAKLLNISLRTFFRHKISALKEYSEALEKIGFNLHFFNEEYASEFWLVSIYDDCVAKSGSQEYDLDKKLVNKVINEISRVKLAYNIYI